MNWDFNGIAAVIAALAGLVAAITALVTRQKVATVQATASDTNDKVSEIHDSTVEATPDGNTG